MAYVFIKKGESKLGFKEISVKLYASGYEKTEVITRYIPRCERFFRDSSMETIYKRRRVVPYGLAHNKCKKTSKENIESVLLSEGYEKLTIDEWYEGNVDRAHMLALSDFTSYRRI